MSAVGLSHVPCTALEYFFKKNAGINNQDLQRIKKKYILEATVQVYFLN